MQECPECKTVSPDGAIRCDCGYSFIKTKAAAPEYQPPPMPGFISHYVADGFIGFVLFVIWAVVWTLGAITPVAQSLWDALGISPETFTNYVYPGGLCVVSFVLFTLISWNSAKRYRRKIIDQRKRTGYR